MTSRWKNAPWTLRDRPAREADLVRARDGLREALRADDATSHRRLDVLEETMGSELAECEARYRVSRVVGPGLYVVLLILALLTKDPPAILAALLMGLLAKLRVRALERRLC